MSKKTLSIIAFVLAFLLPVFGLILGIVAVATTKKGDEGRGFAIAAIVISLLTPILYIMLLGSFAYFGVMNPSELLPAKCTMPTGLSCDDYVVSSADNTISLLITNGMGNDITVNSISAVPAENDLPRCETASQANIDNGQRHNFVLNCAGLSSTDELKRWNLEVEYAIRGSNENRVANGELLTAIE